MKGLIYMNELNMINLENLQSTGIIMVLLGYFGYILRDIPGQIWDVLKVYIFYSIETDTASGYECYQNTISWLVNRYPIFSKHIEYSGYGMLSAKMSNGKYYVFDRQMMCILIISKYRIEHTNVVEHLIRINVLGINKEALLNKYREYIHKQSVFPERSRGLRVLSRDDIEVYSTKRVFDTIYNKNIPIIVEYINNFVNNEQLYINIGIVYKTGFMFYGPPGSGKSSIARAIASYLNYDILYVNEHTSVGTISRIMPRTVVLIEDIDCYMDENRESSKINKGPCNPNLKQMSLQDLLNVIDGVLSPHNVIFIATTNYIDRIDPALKRPGRFDHIIEINYMDEKDVHSMCNHLGIEFADICKDIKLPISGAEMQKILMNKLLWK